MTNGPINEVIVTMTNLILRSSIGKTAFPATDEGEAKFNKWQGDLMHLGQIINAHWKDDNMIVEYAETEFEKIFNEAIK